MKLEERKQVQSDVDLHHVHIFASDIAVTLKWWCETLGAEILFDGNLANSRCVLIGIGSGRINIYDQPPRGRTNGSIHHIGVRTDQLSTLWADLENSGVQSPNGLREQGEWRYVMIEAPDDILVELFEFDDASSPFNLDGRLS